MPAGELYDLSDETLFQMRVKARSIIQEYKQEVW